MTGTCAHCGRGFASLTAFDAHQNWDYTQRPGLQLTCLDPATLLDVHGQPRFRLNRHGRWGSADQRPPEAFPRARQTDEQASPAPEDHPVPAIAS